SIRVAATPPAEHLRRARQWVSYKKLIGPEGVRRASGRRNGRLRVGYLSADFREHAISYLIAGALESHDRGAVEVTAYSYSPPDTSPMRHRIESAVEHFVDIAQMPDQAAAARIADDGIDVLVDLQGYTHHARTGILTFRAAPIQAQFLGYPGTMGIRLVDYLIADKFIIPESQFRHYAERIVHLLDSYQPNDPQRAIGPAPRRSEAGLPGTGVVFCSFNETYKISRAIF